MDSGHAAGGSHVADTMTGVSWKVVDCHSKEKIGAPLSFASRFIPIFNELTDTFKHRVLGD